MVEIKNERDLLRVRQQIVSNVSYIVNGNEKIAQSAIHLQENNSHRRETDDRMDIATLRQEATKIKDLLEGVLQNVDALSEWNKRHQN